MPTRTSEAPKQFLGVEAFDETALETVQSLSPPPGTNFCMVQAQGNSLLWRPDGETPVEGESFVALPTETVCIHQDTPEDIRIVRGSVGASAFVAYYR
jgi:hypothetical protein